MTSQYRTIQGVKYERELLEFAEATAAQGSLKKAAAAELWEKAMDGGRVTPTEARTLRYIMDVHKLDKAAKNFLEGKLQEGSAIVPAAKAAAASGQQLRRKSSQYYTFVDGVRYDKALLEEAQQYSEKGTLTLDHVQDLWASAHDGRGVTDTERRTLEHVVRTYRLTTDAERFLRGVLKMEPLAEGQLVESSTNSRQESATKLKLGDEATTPRQSGWLQTLVSPVTAVRSWLGGTKRPRTEGGDSTPSPAAKRPALEAGTQGSSATGTAEGTPAAKRPALAAGTLGSSSTVTAEAGGVSSSEPAASLLRGLSPELQSLLQEEGDAQGPLALDWPAQPASAEPAEAERRRAQVETEVERILSSRQASDILGQGSREEQHQEFKRIALLLHPDKGIVSKDNRRAQLAMQLALVALRKTRRQT